MTTHNECPTLNGKGTPGSNTRTILQYIDGHVHGPQETQQVVVPLGRIDGKVEQTTAAAAAAAAAAAGGGGIFCTKVVVNGSESQTVRNDHEVYAHQGMPRTDTKFYGYPIKNFQETSILYQYPFFVATCV